MASTESGAGQMPASAQI
uniref:Uncharacterized protein n=1 Tax=Arundo donax TaxID=35708 RepID=A0A0A9HQM0_ARUDO